MATTPLKPISADQWRRISSGLGLAWWACMLLLLPLGFVALGFTAFGGAEALHAWLGVLPPLLGTLGIARIRSVAREMAGTAAPLAAPAPESPRKRMDADIVNPPVTWDRSAVGKLEATHLPEPVTAPRPKKTAAASAPARSSVDWEQWVGQKLMQKVGILIVLVGMVVFLKYSFDNRLIGELGRIALAAAAAIGLLGAGEWFHRKYGAWAQTFTGAGLTLAYFTVWAAHVFYREELYIQHGITVSPALAMMLYALITIIGAAAATRYRSQSIAWFTMLGGYLTPLLISLPQDALATLTVYLALLTAGVLTLSWHRKWTYLPLASFVLTMCYLFGRVYSAQFLSDFGQIVIAVGFFALFALPPLLSQFRLKRAADHDDLSLILLNGVAGFLAVVDASGGFGGDFVGLISLVLAAFYIVLAGTALKKRSEDALLVHAYLLSGIGLIALALYAQMTWTWVAAGWAPFSVLLVWMAVRLERKRVLECAMALLAGSLLFLFINTPLTGAAPEALWHPFTSHWALLSYAVFGSLVCWIVALQRLPAKLLPSQNFRADTMPLLHAVVAVIVFLAVTFEATGLQWAITLPLAFSYLAFSVAAMAAFVFTGVTVWFVAALAAQVLVLLFTFAFGQTSGLTVFGGSAMPFIHPWAGVSLVSMCAMIGLLLAMQRRPGHALNSGAMRGLIIALACSQVWLHVSVEILHLQARLYWTDLMLHRALSVWWIAFSVPLFAWALQSKKEFILRAAIFALCIPLAKDLILLLDGRGELHELALWTALPLGTLLLGTQRKAVTLIRAGVIMLGATMAADMLHTLSSDAGLLRTVWWAVTALITISIGFQTREALIRHLAIGMFGATVIKLMVFDFAALSTGVRILASIVTGLLLIGASYLYQRFNSRVTSPSR